MNITNENEYVFKDIEDAQKKKHCKEVADHYENQLSQIDRLYKSAAQNVKNLENNLSFTINLLDKEKEINSQWNDKFDLAIDERDVYKSKSLKQGAEIERLKAEINRLNN